MKKKLFSILSLVALMGIGGLVSCGEKKVESVTIDPADCQQVKVGGTVQFKATVLPEDASNKNVTWSIDDTSVGTVDQNGLFTAIAVGDATVSVVTKDGNKTASCDVVVDPAPTPHTIDSVVIDPRGTKTIKVGEEIVFKSTVTGTHPNKDAVIWSSSDVNVGDISQQGRFTALAVGTTTVTCKSYFDNTKTDTCVVTVESPAPQSGYYFSYSEETFNDPIKMIINPANDKEYMLPSKVDLKENHLFSFSYSGTAFSVTPKPDVGESRNNVRIESEGLYPHNDANANVYLDISNPDSPTVWVEGYVDTPPETHTYSVSVGDSKYTLVEDAKKKYTYVLSEKISVSEEQQLKFFDNDSEITTNIRESADDSTNKIYNNSQGGKVIWNATSVDISLYVGDSSYSFWVGGGHSFTKDGYYLLGSGLGWDAKRARVTGVDGGDFITFKRIVSAGDKFKVAYVEGGGISEYNGWRSADTSQSVLCTGCTITEEKDIEFGSSGQYIIKLTKEAIVSPQGASTYKYEVTKDTSPITLAYKINDGNYVDFPAPTSVTESEVEYDKYSSSIEFKLEDAVNFYVKQGEGEYSSLVTQLDFYRPYKEFTISQGKEGMVCCTAGTYTIEILNPKTAEKGLFKVTNGTFDTGYYLASNILGWNVINAEGFFFGEIPGGSDNITVPKQTLSGSNKDECSYKFVHIDSTGKKDWNEFDTKVTDNAIDGVNIKLDGEFNNARVLVDTVYVNYVIKATTASLTKYNPEVKYVDTANVEHVCTRGSDGKYAVTPEAGSAFAKNDAIKIKIDGELDSNISIGDTKSFSLSGSVVTCLTAGTYQIAFDLSQHKLIILNKAVTSEYYLKDSDGKIFNLTKNAGSKEEQYDSSVLALFQAQTLTLYDKYDAPQFDLTLEDDTGKMFLNSSADTISAKVDCNVTLYIQPITKKIYTTVELENGFYMISDETEWVPILEVKVADLPTPPAEQSEFQETFSTGFRFKFVKVENKSVSYQTFKFATDPDPTKLVIDEFGNIVIESNDPCKLNFYLKTNGETWVTIDAKA